MDRVNWKRAVGAGLLGTAAMTMLMLAGPRIGMPRMPIGEMLGRFLGIGAAAGWAMHGMIGAGLAAVYAGVLAERLPLRPAVSGMAYGVLVFFVAQLAVTPMMGGGVFSGGNLSMIGGSLMGHLLYGVVLGAVYGGSGRARVPASA